MNIHVDNRVKITANIANAAAVLAKAKIAEEKAQLLSEANGLVEVLKELGGEILGDALGKKDDEILVDADAFGDGVDVEKIAAQLVSMFGKK